MTAYPNPGQKGKSARRGALLVGQGLVIIALLWGGLSLLAGFEHGRPNFYQPARAPLIDAAMILSEIDAEENELGGELQTLRSRMDKAIVYLDQAERLDPKDKQKIETLKKRLLGLEDATRMASADPAALEHTYRMLKAQLSTLAKSLEQRPPT